MRAKVLFFALAFSSLSLPVSAKTLNACPGSAAVDRFELLLEPPTSGATLPLVSVNQTQAGDWLEYKPFEAPGPMQKKSAKVAVVLVPSADSPEKHVTVLAAEPASSAARWKVPFRASVIGLVVGPKGLNVKGVHSFVEKNPDLMPQLAGYARQASTVEALIQALSKYEQSSPGSSNLQSVLNSFSMQYGVNLPAIGASQSTTAQASDLLRAVVPVTSSSPPLTSRQALLAGSTNLAASLATLYFGSPVGLATGATVLFENLRNSLFPRTDFRAALVQSAGSGPLTLCSGNEKAKSGTRIAYFWVQRIPNTPAPAVRLLHPERLPIGVVSPVSVTTASVAQLKLVSRARDWRLVAGKKEIPIPVKVSVGSAGDGLTLDLRKVALAPGDYRLAANWDWTPLPVAGTITVVAYPNLSSAGLTPESQERLVAGDGVQWVKLTGADFEFVKQVELVRGAGSHDPIRELAFTLPLLKSPGKQDSMDVEVDCNAVAPGLYQLRLRQSNGSTQDVSLTIHLPRPTLKNLPLRLNVGEADQTVLLKGSGLDRVRQITSPYATWTLAPVPAGQVNLTSRGATVALGAGVRPGDKLPASLSVADLRQPLTIPDAIEVIGPLPKIVSVEKSFAGQQDVELFPGEIPAETPGSFLIHTENAGSQPEFDLACADSGSQPGQAILGASRPASPKFERTGPDSFFLSLDPSGAAPSGCLLTLSVRNAETGVSTPFPLGRLVLLPRIDEFTLSGEKEQGNLYIGMLTGQNLQEIAKAGWDPKTGYDVLGIPTPVAGQPQEQTVKIVLPWPAPSPRAPLYIWLRGENQGRLTTAKY